MCTCTSCEFSSAHDVSLNHSISSVCDTTNVTRLYPVYTIKQTSSWLVQLTRASRASSSRQLHRVNGVEHEDSQGAVPSCVIFLLGVKIILKSLRDAVPESGL